MERSFSIAKYHPDQFSMPRVLLVEDDLNAQMIFKFYLSKLKMQVTTVNNGRKALEAIKNTVYDIMVLDIGLPDLTGDYVLATIRTKERLTKSINNLPIIVVTAHGDQEKSHGYLQQGASAALIKPISFATLSMWCKKLLLNPRVTKAS